MSTRTRINKPALRSALIPQAGSDASAGDARAIKFAPGFALRPSSGSWVPFPKEALICASGPGTCGNQWVQVVGRLWTAMFGHGRPGQPSSAQVPDQVPFSSQALRRAPGPRVPAPQKAFKCKPGSRAPSPFDYLYTHHRAWVLGSHPLRVLGSRSPFDHLCTHYEAHQPWVRSPRPQSRRLKAHRVLGARSVLVDARHLHPPRVLGSRSQHSMVPRVLGSRSQQWRPNAHRVPGVRLHLLHHENTPPPRVLGSRSQGHSYVPCKGHSTVHRAYGSRSLVRHSYVPRVLGSRSQKAFKHAAFKHAPGSRVPAPCKPTLGALPSSGPRVPVPRQALICASGPRVPVPMPSTQTCFGF